MIAAGSHLVTTREVTGAADAAALAAADSLTGWLAGEPCEEAARLATTVGAAVSRCTTTPALGEARIVLTKNTPLGLITARARAGGVDPADLVGTRGGEWVWPAAVAGITQGFHDGLAIDLAAPINSSLLAPFDGVVVAIGPDGGGIPAPCRAEPSWWRGANETVVLRHEYAGVSLYSSHNHVTPGSAHRLGVELGDRVRAGQPVATAGMSGCTSGPHSHFTLSTRPENSFPDMNPFEFLPPP